MDTVKHFYCNTKELCAHRNEWATNNRCFAPYAIRSSCPNIARKDGLSWKQGSEENEELVRGG